MSVADFNLAVSHAVIELDNLIINGMRCFIISSLGGARRTAGGRVNAPKIFNAEGEAAAFVLRLLSPTRFSKMGSPVSITYIEEMMTRQPSDVIKVVRGAGLSNLDSAQDAASLSLTVFNEIKIFRHFFCHRNPDTYGKAIDMSRRIGIFNEPDIHKICSLRRVSSVSSLLFEWNAQVKAYFEELVK